jgi:hypothetical protein
MLFQRTPHIIASLAKSTAVHLVKNLSTFYGTGRLHLTVQPAKETSLAVEINIDRRGGPVPCLYATRTVCSRTSNAANGSGRVGIV